MLDVNDRMDIYEKDSLNTIIKNNIDSVDELQKQWDEFMGMVYKKRRNSDDISIQLTGFDNQQRYEMQMKDLRESYLDITPSMIKDAKKWSLDSNIVMIYPTDNLDELHARFLDQIKDNRRKADWKAIDLYGMDNEQLYQMLKNKETSIVSIQKSDDVELSNKLIELDTEEPTNYIESCIKNYNINKIAKTISNKFKQDKIKWEFIYSPYFTPTEIIQLKEFYSDIIDPKYEAVFKKYRDYYYGYLNEFNILEWKSMVDELNYKISIESNSDRINEYKEELLMIGWNPEIEFNASNSAKAKVRLEELINRDYKNVMMCNIQSLYESYNETETPIEESIKEQLYPIHIVLVKGTSLFSNLTVKVTNGPFSHAALCVDNDFTKLYSFNMNSPNGKGFSLENINNYPKDNRVGIYTFFVDGTIYNKINNNLQKMLYFIDNTKYSIVNLLTLPFKNINLNMGEKQICSQFVDKTLKLANIDLTNKSSDKVTPNYLYNVAISNSKIYQTYDGIVKDFNNKKAENFINKMAKTGKKINENNLIKAYALQYTYPVISEARKVPIQFSDTGDLLISKPDSIMDLNSEYYNAHKLLIQYEKTNNLDGIKYELARLYFMNYLLEKRIYSNKHKKYRENNIKIRARALNDFNKYLQFVLSKDKNFNFGKYYEESPFYHNTIEVKSSTLKHFKQIINDIL